jgi:hypothetical protein
LRQSVVSRSLGGEALFGTTRQALELIGYFYGLGALIIIASAFAIAHLASRRRLAEEAPLEAGRVTRGSYAQPAPAGDAKRPASRRDRVYTRATSEPTVRASGRRIAGNSAGERVGGSRCAQRQSR